MSIILDIEAVPQERFLTNPPQWFVDSKWNPQPKLGNLKDPDKIAVKTQEWEEKGGRIYDLSTNPMTAMPICITLKNSEQIGSFYGKKLIDDGEPQFNLIQSELLSDSPLITHNGKNYDLPLLTLYCAQQGWWEQARDFTRLITGKYDVDRHIDLMQYFEVKFGLPYMSLEDMGKFLDIPVKKHGDGSEIYGWYRAGKWDDIREHCNNDVELTLGIAKKLGLI